MNVQRTIIAALLAAALSSEAKSAAIVAYDNAVVPTSTLQYFGQSLGLDFTVVSAVDVVALGAFDDGIVADLRGADLASGVTVAIYAIATGVRQTPSVTFTPTNAGTQIGGDAFLPIAPTLLSPGSYTVVAYNDDNTNSLGAFNPSSTFNGGGLITATGAGRYGGGFTFPTRIDGGPSNRYDAGTFEFVAAPSVTPTPIPEASSFDLMFAACMGVLAFVVGPRRTKPKATRPA